MMRRPIAFNWQPTTFLGRVLAVAVGLCLFAVLLVVSIAAVFVALAAMGLYLGYWWWKRRSIEKRTRSTGGLVIDVTPEVLDERPAERAREREHR